MKLLLHMAPTVFFVVFSQLITKWRVSSLLQAMDDSRGRLDRFQIYLKDPWILSAYLASFLASAAWMFVVEKYDISLAFPIYIGLIVFLVTIGGVLFFNESWTALRILSVALILTGVVIGSRT